MSIKGVRIESRSAKYESSCGDHNRAEKGKQSQGRCRCVVEASWGLISVERMAEDDGRRKRRQDISFLGISLSFFVARLMPFT
jgi:hypothetical protein